MIMINTTTYGLMHGARHFGAFQHLNFFKVIIIIIVITITIITFITIIMVMIKRTTCGIIITITTQSSS